MKICSPQRRRERRESAEVGRSSLRFLCVLCASAVKIAFITLCAIAVFLAFTPQAGAQKKAKTVATPTPQPQAQPSATPGLWISLPQIAARADELDVLLGEMAARLAPDAELDSIDQTLRSQEELILAHQREADALIGSNPTYIELRDVEQDWLGWKNQLSGWRKTLSERAKVVEETVRSLDSHQTQWTATLNQNQNADAAMAPVLGRIGNALNEIQAAKSKGEGLLNLIVALQNRISERNQVVKNVLGKINEANARLQRSLFEPDSLPLWEVGARRHADQSLDTSFRRAINQDLIRSQDFFKIRRRGLWAIFIFFLACLTLNLAFRRRILQRAEEEPAFKVSAMIFRYPATLALLAALIVVMLVISKPPILVRNTIMLLFVIPVLRFLPPLIGPLFRPLLYLLVVFGSTVGLLEMLGFSQAVKREVTVGLCLAAVAVGVWLIRPARIRRLQPSGEKPTLAIIAICAVLAYVFAAAVANIFGYVMLSRVLRTGAILSAFFAVVLYTAYIAMTCVFSLFWRSRQFSMLSSVRTHQETVAKRGSHLLGLAAFVLWLYGALNFFTVRERVLGAVSSALTTPIKVGAASFTPGDVLTFALVLILGVIFARMIRIVLWSDILVRLPLKHGLPYAISTITYYVLVLVGFFFALAAGGVELSRFTLLTGAFGVGIGFGLQNVINNFVSGIILLFERPVRIGDFLEVGSATGHVERIGMRSTSIRTPQGAEVILPNSNLISNQVINWTLTEQRRRSELPVEVAYGTDPERVLKLLVEVAASHPDVLEDPKPVAVFLGFGNSALGFELRFWVPRAQMHHQVKSDIGVKVAAALRETGIEIALPRRELYVKTIDDSSHRDALLPDAAAPHVGPVPGQQTQKEGGAQER